MAGLPQFLTFNPSTTRRRIFETTNGAATVQNGRAMKDDIFQAFAAISAETT
jgi:hypothetical protein